MFEIILNIYNDYTVLLRDVTNTFHAYAKESEANYTYPWDFVRDLEKFTRVSLLDVLLGLGMACLFSLFRLTLTACIFIVSHFKGSCFPLILPLPVCKC